MRQTQRALVAEFVGTFMFVFVGAGAIIANTLVTAQTNTGPGLAGIAVAHGLALAIAVTATLAISGGHINPAITIGLWSVGRIDARKAGLYVVAQLVGAALAAMLLKALLPAGAGQVAQLGALTFGDQTSFSQGFFIEAVLTFFLALSVMATAVDPRAPKIGGFGIGLTLWMCILVGGPMTGAGLNPARWFGPALVAGYWKAWLAYILGPIVGAVIATQLYERVLLKKD